MCSLPFFNVFCCKQKTSYEVRISDWSSDVCSSDLSVGAIAGMGEIGGHQIGLEAEILGRGQRAAAEGIDTRAEAGAHRLAGEDRPQVVEAVRMKPADAERSRQRHQGRVVAGRAQRAPVAANRHPQLDLTENSRLYY